MTLRRASAIVCLLVVQAAFAADEDLVLARDGQALARIVVPANKGVVGFAAEELKLYLDQITGADFAIVTAPGPSPNIYLGDQPAARAAGLSVDDLPRDGYHRAVIGDDLFLLGRDEPGQPKFVLHLAWERGTLFAVYHFLEDVAGVRFIKAGPHGEVVPPQPTFAVPREQVSDAPYYTDRRMGQMGLQYYQYPDHAKHETPRAEGDPLGDRVRWALRAGWQSDAMVMGSHSSHYLEFDERFAKDHPDWFALQPNGERAIDTPRGSYLCYSHPGVIDTFIQDARAYFSGQPPESRGLTTWNKSGYGDEFLVDPHDSYIYCQCEDCRRVFEADPDQDYSEIIFRAVAEIAAACQEFDGKYISTLAYGPKRMPPKTVALPENVRIRLCIAGPWAQTLPGSREAQMDLIRAWSERLNGDLVLWLYPNAARPTKPIAGVVETGPRAIAQFLRDVKPYVKGAYFENEAMAQTYRFLDEYLMLKLLWDPDQDVDALLTDYFAKFYGPAARPIQEIYARLEELWTRTYTLYGGDSPRYASRIDLWEKIVTPAELAELRGKVAAAKTLAAADEAYAWRVALIEEDLVGRLAAFREDYERTLGAAQQTECLAHRSPVEPNAAGLLPAEIFADVPAQPLDSASEEHGLTVATSFRTLWTPAALHLLIDVEEPDMVTSATLADRQPDDPNLWKDQTVEVFLTYHDERIMSEAGFQVLVNDQGVIADVTHQLGASDWGWDSGAKVAVEPTEGGWRARLAIPFEELGLASPLAQQRLAFNVTRHRSRRGLPPEYYGWSTAAPVGTWADPTRYGTLLFSPAPPAPNLVAGGGLNAAENARQPLAGWIVPNADIDKISRDETVRWEGAGAARLELKEPGSATLLQYLPELKPNTTYRFACKVRTENVVAAEPGLQGALVQFYAPGFNRHVPDQALTGTNDWRNLAFEVTTAADPAPDKRPYLRLQLREARGIAWFDDVRLTEVPK